MYLSLLAPAKINLSLRIVGRRADGYHLIDSLIAPISLFDTVRLRCRRGEGIRVTSNDPTLPTGKENLVWRAAELALRLSRAGAAVHIDLVKRIPVGAGLGGGSSDAAAVLLGLNRLLCLGWSLKKLAAAGVELGADVPSLVIGRPARLAGIGERVRPVARFRRRWLVVAWPGFPISTKWVYGRFRDSLTKKGSAPMIRGSAKGLKPLRDTLVNDLEAVVAATHPEVHELKEHMLALGAEASLMSGSGSAVYGVFADRRETIRVAAALRRTGVWARAAHTLAGGPPFTRGDGRSPSW